MGTLAVADVTAGTLPILGAYVVGTIVDGVFTALTPGTYTTLTTSSIQPASSAGITVGTAGTDGGKIIFRIDASGVGVAGLAYSRAGTIRLQLLYDGAGDNFRFADVNGTPLVTVSPAGAMNCFFGLSAYGGFTHQTGTATVCAATATPANGSSSARLLFGTTAAFGIYYGSGAPAGLTAAQGSLYLRSDGTGVADRAYINSSSGSGTTWAAIATAA